MDLSLAQHIVYQTMLLVNVLSELEMRSKPSEPTVVQYTDYDIMKRHPPIQGRQEGITCPKSHGLRLPRAVRYQLLPEHQEILAKAPDLFAALRPLLQAAVEEKRMNTDRKTQVDAADRVLALLERGITIPSLDETKSR